MMETIFWTTMAVCIAIGIAVVVIIRQQRPTDQHQDRGWQDRWMP